VSLAVVFAVTSDDDQMGHYRGSEGVDFNANLAVKSIDFGTFHVRTFYALIFGVEVYRPKLTTIIAVS
jgi:hypothetical protein